MLMYRSITDKAFLQPKEECLKCGEYFGIGRLTEHVAACRYTVIFIVMAQAIILMNFISGCSETMNLTAGPSPVTVHSS